MYQSSLRCFPLSLVLMLLLSSASAAMAAGVPDYREMSPAALLEHSWGGPSGVERAIIRRYLADEHGETAEGLFAAAWLANRNEREDETRRLYRRALDRDPTLAAAAVNLARAVRDDDPHEALALYQQVFQTNPDDLMLVRDIYFHKLEILEDEAAARRFLETQTRRLGSDAWVIQLIQGLHTQFHDNDRAAAAPYYRRAALAGADFEAMRRYINLSLDYLGMDLQQGFGQLNGYARARPEHAAQAYRLLGDKLLDGGHYPDALRVFEASMSAYPTAEALEGGFRTVNYLPEAAIAFVDRWAPRMADNWQAQMVWAESHDEHRFDIGKAQRLRQRSVDLAPHAPALTTAVAGWARALHQRFELESAHALLREHLDGIGTDAGRDRMLAGLIENRLRAGAFDAAVEYERQLAASEQTGVNKSWAANAAERVQRARMLADERRDFLERHPFLADWEDRFGETLSVAIEFAVNSDVIPRSAYPLLADAARALQGPRADEYLFMIEGHTDSTGTDEVNLPLSQRRAEAVARHLREHHGISRERLQSAGHGPRHPVATNASEEGRQRNRRVEILPYGNLSDPQVAVSGYFDISGLASSGDGRLIATGTEPIQLWDVRRGVKVRELFRGGNRKFSPNSRYLAAASTYTEVTGNTSNELYVYDTKTGHTVAQVPEFSRIIDFAWSPFSDAVAYTTIDGAVKVYDLGERRVRSVRRMGVRGSGGVVEWLPDGERIVTNQVHHGLVIWNARDLSEKHRFARTDWPHAMKATADGRWLVQVDNSRRITLFDTRNWESRTLEAPVVPKRMEAHPSRPLIAMNNFSNQGPAMALLDVAAGRIIATSEHGKSGFGFTPAGDTLLAAGGDQVKWLSTDSLAEVDVLEGMGLESSALIVDRDNDYVITEDAEGSYVFDLTTGRRVHRMVTDNAVGWARRNASGSELITVDGDGHLVVFSTDDFAESKRRKLDFEPTGSIARDGERLVIRGVPRGQSPSADAVGIVAVLDRESLTEVSRVRVPLVTRRIQYGRVLDPEIASVALNAERGLLAVHTSWRDGFGRPVVYSQHVKVFDLETGRDVATANPGSNAWGIGFDDDGAALRVTRRGSTTAFYDPTNGSFLRSEPARATRQIELEDGRTVTWARDHIALGDKRIFLSGSLRRVRVHEARNMLVAQTVGNELLFHDLQELEHHLTIVIKRDDQWIAYTPDGHFSASQYGTDGVYWSLGDNYLPFEALSGQLERGRLVQRRLEALMADEPAEPVSDERPAVDPEWFGEPYRVTVDSPSGIETEQATYRLRIKVERASDELPVPELSYRLNGRPVPRTRGGDAEIREGADFVEIERPFRLQAGYNRIEAAVQYRGAQVGQQVVEVTRREAASATELGSNTQLWFFGVGISDYEISTQNLEFAHRDAEELERLFKAQEGTLFQRVNTRVITNEEATERNVRIEMNDFLRTASGEDVIVIFLAGHGIQDSDQNLYLITHDGDMRRPYTGMSIDRFRDFLASRPINQKAVFMMDICHAGTVGPRRRGRITAEDAVQQLSDGTGTVVFASSSGAQYSLEDESYGGGHGAFTAALLEGLSGRADTEAGNRDGFTSIQELISYTSRRVPQLTRGAQHPTVPRLENMRDFPISAASD